MLKILSRFRTKGLLKPFREDLARVNSCASLFSSLSDEQLQARVAYYKAHLSEGTNFAGILPEVVAFIRECGARSLNLTAYDEQILGVLALVDGAIAEMATGEGKTLVAPIAAIVHHWCGRKVHISTANEYLAQRDAQAMFPLYQFVGLKVGVRRSTHSDDVTQGVYSCDVVYGVDQLFAQDYLHDNLVAVKSACYQQGHGALILDEADSALIDNAKVPVAVNASYPADAARYEGLATLVAQLVRGTDSSADCDFYLDGPLRTAVLTDAGYEKVCGLLRSAGLVSPDEQDYSPVLQQACQQMVFTLTAHYLLQRDQDYVLQDGAIVLVDALTGRLVPGRRWDSGLQQALEAKEGLQISPESVVLARITLQNYFKLYASLSGMTGTAVTEEEEIQAVYGCHVVPIPTHKPSQRIDEPDQFFHTQELKLKAVVADVLAANAVGQPVLIGTASVEQSEQLSARLTEVGVPHEVLNARQHAREAEIIAQAGALGAVTVSTNMAGRGVDIVLGGNVQLTLQRTVLAMGEKAWEALSDEQQAEIITNARAVQKANAEEVRAAGGLRVLGLERYESRRQDRQLRGRAGRQGDPGSTCFFLSLQDPLISNFAGEQIRKIFDSLDVKDGDDFQQALVAKAVDAAQRQVEGSAYDARKSMMTYDNVLDEQRRAFYAQRQQVLSSNDNLDWIGRALADYGQVLVDTHVSADALVEEWDIPGLRSKLTGKSIDLPTDAELLDMDADAVGDLVLHRLIHKFEATLAKIEDQVPEVSADLSPEQRQDLIAFHKEGVARNLLIVVMGRLWTGHLDELDTLRRGIHLRAHAKEVPQQAYKREAFKLFDQLLWQLREDVVHLALTFEIADVPAPATEDQPDGG